MTGDTVPVTQALLPCPFCGGIEGAFIERADFSSAYVMCNDCGSRGPTSCDETEDDSNASENGDCEPGERAARRLWNTRATPTPSPAMPSREENIAAVVEALDDLQQTEAEYRLMHDRHGDGARATGRAWGLMRRAGDKARRTLAALTSVDRASEPVAGPKPQASAEVAGIVGVLTPPVIALINRAAAFMDGCAGMELEVEGDGALDIVEALHAELVEDSDRCFHEDVETLLAALGAPPMREG